MSVHAMTVQGFYQLALWLPLVVPVSLLLAMKLVGVQTQAEPWNQLVQLLLGSLVYGGIPYLVSAIAATIWIDRRSEPEIRRLALQSPLWVIAAWTPLVTYVSIRADSLAMFGGLMALGGGAILVLGYAYVAIVFALRHVAGRAGMIRPSTGSEPALAG